MMDRLIISAAKAQVVGLANKDRIAMKVIVKILII